MKNKELFDRTIAILVKAYNDKTLQHMNCYACAVGNLVAANCGYIFIQSHQPWLRSDQTYLSWLGEEYPSSSVQGSWMQGIDSLVENDQTKSTGYTVKELASIEESFEKGSNSERTDAFAGLRRVIMALGEIHEASPEEINAAKELIIK